MLLRRRRPRACERCDVPPLPLPARRTEGGKQGSLDAATLAMTFGQDDARALRLAGFSVGMDAHDRAGAFTAFEAALALSPSCALTYILGSVVAGRAGEAERAIDWSEQGMRLSPFDPWAFAAYDAQALGYFKLGRFEEAARAAYRAVQANPAHSISYKPLAAALSRSGQMDDARVAAFAVLRIAAQFQRRPTTHGRRLRADAGSRVRISAQNSWIGSTGCDWHATSFFWQRQWFVECAERVSVNAPAH